MALRFAATLNAVNRGLESMSRTKAVDLIEDWETALSDVDVPGAKGIARDLAALRKQLEKDEPDSARVLDLIHRLGAATVKIATRADDKQDKINELGEALNESGEAQPDEEVDKDAAAAPKRRKSAAK